ncbi:response regulator [Austwickia chelonae]|uniref:response regulator n=1 Tax=Austwickia chelonae TaxID=100225 RepID=UPI000E2679CA|nr:response regulator transcription factor [Austwickia chelonae]
MISPSPRPHHHDPGPSSSVDDPHATPTPVRLLLVDDDHLVRAGLRLILGGSPGLDIIGEADDGVTGVSEARRLRPDIVLMDVRMPRMDGLTATRTLLEDPHPPKVIVLTTFDADDMVLSALAAGASGFLLKHTPPHTIVQSVHSVARGEHSLSPSVMAQVIAAATRSSQNGPADDRAEQAATALRSLTSRERDVALAIGRGASNAEIAQELYLSIATVKGHVARLFEKLQVDNRVQIAIRVHDAGLL